MVVDLGDANLGGGVEQEDRVGLALQLVPLYTRAMTCTFEPSEIGLVYGRAAVDKAPPGSRGSLPSSV